MRSTTPTPAALQDAGEETASPPRARRWPVSYRALSPYWKLQLPMLAGSWVSAIVYCEGLYGRSWKTIAMGTWSLVIIAVTNEVLRASYQRLLARSPRTSTVVVQVLCQCLPAAVITSAVTKGVDRALHWSDPSEHTPWRIVLCVFMTTQFYISWSVVYFALKLKATARAAQDQLREVQALAKQAELAMLRYQLNPHFLFNSLTSLRHQIVEDADKARTMTSELAHYLRHTLRYDGRPETPLGDELRAIESYLALEKSRFDERLEVTFEIEPDARNWQTPVFFLQTLVENAIKHGGPGRKESPLRLCIEARCEARSLEVAVSNTGTWSGERASPEGGIGLTNLRRRLEALYPGRHELVVGPDRPGWVRARVTISSQT